MSYPNGFVCTEWVQRGKNQMEVGYYRVCHKQTNVADVVFDIPDALWNKIKYTGPPVVHVVGPNDINIVNYKSNTTEPFEFTYYEIDITSPLWNEVMTERQKHVT